MRVKRGNVLRKRHKKILKLAKGFIGARSRIFKVANCAVMKALKYAYRDRRATKRNMRSLWIVRINAAVRERGMSYSRFVNACKKANITYICSKCRWHVHKIFFYIIYRKKLCCFF